MKIHWLPDGLHFLVLPESGRESVHDQRYRKFHSAFRQLVFNGEGVLCVLLIDLISLYLIATTVYAFYWGVHIRVLNSSNYARVLLMLTVAVCFYIFGYTMELNSSSQSQILFWNLVEYIGIPFVSALWLTTALMYTGHFTHHKKLWLAAIFIIPAITLILRFTNDSSHWYFASVGFSEAYGRLIFIKKAGLWQYVQAFHSMLMIFVSMGLFIRDSIKSEEKQNRKILLMAVAAVFAVAGLILSLLKPFGPVIDYMALCLPVTCVTVILAIARYDLLEIKAIARNMAFDSGYDAILLLNRQNKVLDYNIGAKQLCEQLHIRLDNGYLAALFEGAPELLKGLENTEQSIVKLNIHAEDRYFDIITKSIRDHHITHGWIKTIRDVTETCQLNAELKRLALTDELSGLNNRRAFFRFGKERLPEFNAGGKESYLLMMDLDHFKNINDQYGHPAGDLVIRDFSRILKIHFGAEGLTARFGGEEFAVLHSGLSDTEMMQYLTVFLTAAAKHIYHFQDSRFHVTVSIGAVKWQSGQTLENALNRADKALYQSKERGRNCITLL